MVSWGWGLVSWGMSVSLLGLWWVDWGSLVGDIGDESVDVVSGVSGGLDSAVGKGNHVASGDNTVAILGLRLLEVGLAVVISNSVFVGEWLRGELLLDVWGWFVISWGWGIGNWDLVGSDDGEEGSGSKNLKIFIEIFFSIRLLNIFFKSTLKYFFQINFEIFFSN